jgi:predicted transcriptional regulator
MLKRHANITGETREKLAAILKEKYEDGASIRELSESTGRSYGFVYRVLADSGVTMRRQGKRRTAVNVA